MSPGKGMTLYTTSSLRDNEQPKPPTFLLLQTSSFHLTIALFKKHIHTTASKGGYKTLIKLCRVVLLQSISFEFLNIQKYEIFNGDYFFDCVMGKKKKSL